MSRRALSLGAKLLDFFCLLHDTVFVDIHALVLARDRGF